MGREPETARSLMARKEANQLVRRLRREGFVVTPLSSGHWRVTTAEGEFVTTFAGSPGGNNRWRMNTLAAARKATRH